MQGTLPEEVGHFMLANNKQHVTCGIGIALVYVGHVLNPPSCRLSSAETCSCTPAQ